MAVLAVVVLVHNFFQLEVSGDGLDGWNNRKIQSRKCVWTSSTLKGITSKLFRVAHCVLELNFDALQQGGVLQPVWAAFHCCA